jgi:hypothetical protein
MILVRSGSQKGYYREYKPSKDSQVPPTALRSSFRKPRKVDSDSVQPPRKKNHNVEEGTIVREIIEPIFDRDLGKYNNRGYVSQHWFTLVFFQQLAFILNSILRVIRTIIIGPQETSPYTIRKMIIESFCQANRCISSPNKSRKTI